MLYKKGDSVKRNHNKKLQRDLVLRDMESNSNTGSREASVNFQRKPFYLQNNNK